MPLTLINQHLRLASYLPALAALSVCLLTAAPVHAYKVEKTCEEVKSKDGNKKICKVVRVAEKPGDKKEAVVEKDAKGKPIAPKKDASGKPADPKKDPKKEEKKEEKKADPKAAAPKH
jgi:hypothetical protein